MWGGFSGLFNSQRKESSNGWTRYTIKFVKMDVETLDWSILDAIGEWEVYRKDMLIGRSKLYRHEVEEFAIENMDLPKHVVKVVNIANPLWG